MAVSGLAIWDRDRERMTVDLSLGGALHGRLRGGWDTRAVGAWARLHGVVDGRQVAADLPRALTRLSSRSASHVVETPPARASGSPEAELLTLVSSRFRV